METTVLNDKWSKHNNKKSFGRYVFSEAVAHSKTYSGVTDKLNLHGNGTVNTWIRDNIKRFHLSTTHWKRPVGVQTSPFLLSTTTTAATNTLAFNSYECTNCCRAIPFGHKICSTCHWTNGPATTGKINLELLEQSVRLFFQGIGDDPNRSGIKDTPKRVAKMWAETMNGFFLNPEDYVKKFDNDESYDGPVVLRDAEFYATCEHHLQPFAGTIDIAYQPGTHVLGLSKLLRIARVFAKRPQVQERLTKQVADALNEILEPAWVVVRIKAEHHCMKLRGVRINGSHTVTMYGHGEFPDGIFHI